MLYWLKGQPKVNWLKVIAKVSRYVIQSIKLGIRLAIMRWYEATVKLWKLFLFSRVHNRC